MNMDVASSETNESADARAIRRWSEHVGRLHAARHIAICPALGNSVAVAVVAVVGIVLLIARGQVGVLGALPHVLVAVAGFGLLAWFMGPRIERMLAKAANEPAQPWMCPALMEAACGLPMLRGRRRYEEGLANCLATVTPEWWEANKKEMHGPVAQMLVGYEAPNWLRPVDGPALPALMDAIGRCERTEFLKRVEGFEASVRDGSFPDGAVQAVRRCADALRARAKRDREAATLLRPAEAPNGLLVRPVEPRAPQHDALLVRPSQGPGRADALPSEMPTTVAGSEADKAMIGMEMTS